MRIFFLTPLVWVQLYIYVYLRMEYTPHLYKNKQHTPSIPNYKSHVFKKIKRRLQFEKEVEVCTHPNFSSKVFKQVVDQVRRTYTLANPPKHFRPLYNKRKLTLIVPTSYCHDPGSDRITRIWKEITLPVRLHRVIYFPLKPPWRRQADGPMG